MGLETQRQWSAQAIARTTPILLGLFSLVTRLAHRLVHAGRLPVRATAWYQKPPPTLSDAFTAVRAALWRHHRFHMSAFRPDIPKPVRRVLTHLTTILCEAA